MNEVDEMIKKIDDFGIGDKKKVFTRVKSMLQEANKPFIAKIKAMTTPELEKFLKSKGHPRADFFKIKNELDSRGSKAAVSEQSLEEKVKEHQAQQQDERDEDY